MFEKGEIRFVAEKLFDLKTPRQITCLGVFRLFNTIFEKNRFTSER